MERKDNSLREGDFVAVEGEVEFVHSDGKVTLRVEGAEGYYIITLPSGGVTLLPHPKKR